MIELSGDENILCIFIVEDELKFGQLLIDYLQVVGYVFVLINYGDKVLFYVCQMLLYLILLDLMLFGIDGLMLCWEICCFFDVLVVMVMVKIEEIDCLLGLEIGVDDYICKFYSFWEVVVWVKIIFCCCKLQCDLQVLDVQSLLIVDEGCFQVFWCDKLLDFIFVEFWLLKIFFQELGKVFFCEQLFNYLYDDYWVVIDCIIDSYIKNLWCKLEVLDVEQLFICVVYGVGYCWEVDVCWLVQLVFFWFVLCFVGLYVYCYL